MMIYLENKVVFKASKLLFNKQEKIFLELLKSFKKIK